MPLNSLNQLCTNDSGQVPEDERKSETPPPILECYANAQNVDGTMVVEVNFFPVYFLFYFFFLKGR